MPCRAQSAWQGICRQKNQKSSDGETPFVALYPLCSDELAQAHLLDNVKRLIDRFQIYYRRAVQLRLHFRSVRKLESRRDEPAPEHLRDRCEFRIAKSASF